MKAPALGNAGEGGVSNSIASEQHCPWPCFHHGAHTQLSDPTGRVRGTLCGICEQFVSREDWLAELAAAQARKLARGF